MSLLRRTLVLVAIAVAPATASAQFTTFIPPQTRVADSVKAAVAAAQQVQQDSTTQAQLTNMKTWVDSAAGVTPPPATAADSAAMQLSRTNGGDTAAYRADTATFANGMRAPATASDLPLLAVSGLAALVLGVVLLGGRAHAPDRPSRRA